MAIKNVRSSEFGTYHIHIDAQVIPKELEEYAKK